ncbi:MAG: DUF4124 domain-containing protein [Halioglobus sp.]
MKLLLALLLFSCLTAQAQTVYRSVDETGAVSFSDTPPENDKDAEEVSLNVVAPQDPEAYQQNLDDMRETTDRMAEDRREREKHRAEMRELAARTAPQQSQPQQQNLVDQYSTSWGYEGSYYNRPGRPPWRPGYRPKPEQPIYRPPLQPQPRHPLEGNSQLMRPMLSR